jgi:enoyl-[acyl-carrier protein] reductase II
MVTDADDTGTLLALKKIGLVRMLKNDFALRAFNADESGADKETLLALLGRKRERMGIFEGDVTEGMFEAGQGSGLINEILPVSEIFHRLISQYDSARQALS